MKQKGKGRYHVYTDGSCFPGGHGGYSFLVLSSDKTNVLKMQSGYLPESTNNIAELQAILQALLKMPDVDLTIYTDSKYSIDALTYYYKIWMRTNWVTSSGEPVRNKELIQSILKLMSGRQVSFTKVKGHAGEPLNTVCDYLAKSAAKSLGK